MAKIKIISHGANSLEKIKAAFAAGADLVEVDVSKQVFTSRFVAQHQGVLGKFGIGPNLISILQKVPKGKIIFDLKHPRFTPSFFKKFDQLLQKFNFNSTYITSDNWPTLKKFATTGNYQTFFLVENSKNAERLVKTNTIQKNKKIGVVISVKFLNYARLAHLKENGFQIFLGPINDFRQVEKAVSAGVDGIITDEVSKLAKFLKTS